MSMIPSCKYCGQIMETSREFSNTAEAEAYASRFCRCPGAVDARAREEMVATAKEKIEVVCGEAAVDYGFEPVAEIVMDLLDHIVNAIGEEKITAANLVLVSGEKIGMGLASEKIKISRRTTRSLSLG